MKVFTIEGQIVTLKGLQRARVEIDRRTGLISEVREVIGKADLVLGDELIFPGFLDLHVHARQDETGSQNYKEDFTTAGLSALAGGVVHIADMPNNPKPPLSDESYGLKEALAKNCPVGVTLYAGIGLGSRPLSRVVPYKVFMGPSVGDLYFETGWQLEETLKFYKNQNVSFHCEDAAILEKNRNQSVHEASRPEKAEIAGLELALKLTEKYGLKAKICHVSTAAAAKRIAAAKDAGLPVTAEVTPHHLYFDTAMITDLKRPWLRVNPPLRPAADRRALLSALKEGVIDYLATDHAPHTREEKLAGISGMPHLDTYGSFACWLMVEQHFTPSDIARVCAQNSARFLKPFLGPEYGRGYGEIEPGFMGCLTVLDQTSPYMVTRQRLKTKCGWSPFEGLSFPGRVAYTIVRGKLVASRK